MPSLLFAFVFPGMVCPETFIFGFLSVFLGAAHCKESKDVLFLCRERDSLSFLLFVRYSVPYTGGETFERTGFQLFGGAKPDAAQRS